jgi:hypothetical protein
MYMLPPLTTAVRSTARAAEVIEWMRRESVAGLAAAS